VSRLAARLAGVEARFRREQQAWFPALAVTGFEGPAALMRDRQAEALEALRRLRLAVARDDAGSAVESGVVLLDLVEDLAAVEDQILTLLAARCLSSADWVAVRQHENGVGWSLIAPPSLWPGA